jgi:hypothetical protein
MTYISEWIQKKKDEGANGIEVYKAQELYDIIYANDPMFPFQKHLVLFSKEMKSLPFVKFWRTSQSNKYAIDFSFKETKSVCPHCKQLIPSSE